MKKSINHLYPLDSLCQSVKGIGRGKSEVFYYTYAYLHGYPDVEIRPYYTKTKALTKSAQDISYQLSTTKAKVRENRIRMDIACNNPKQFIKKVSDFQKKIDLKVAQNSEAEKKDKKDLVEAIDSLNRIGINPITVKKDENLFIAKCDGFSFEFMEAEGYIYPVSFNVFISGKISSNITSSHLYRLIDQVNTIQNGPKEAGVSDGTQNKEGARNKMVPEGN